MKNCECYAIINEPTRKALYAGIFPEDHVPIKPEEVTGTDDNGKVQWRGWLTDFDRVTKEQNEEIIARVAKAFNAPNESVRAQIVQAGMPLRADGVDVHFCRNHLRYGKDTFDARAFM